MKNIFRYTHICFILFILTSCKTHHTEQSVVKSVNGINYEFVKVEGGTFDMGYKPSLLQRILDKRNDCACSPDDKTKNVEVKSFYIGKFLITYPQFAQFIEETNYVTSLDSLKRFYVSIQDTTNKVAFPKGTDYKIEGKGMYGYDAYIRNINWQYTPYFKKYTKDDFKYPVAFLSIYDARTFCKWLSKKLNKNIRLLTDEEWEFAARGGNYSKGYCRAGTNESFEDILDVDTTYSYRIRPNYEIDARIPNELGIYGLNDGEMVDSYYKPNIYDDPVIIVRNGVICRKAIILGEYNTIAFGIHFRVVMDISELE